MKKSIFSALCLVLLATTTQSAWGQNVFYTFQTVTSTSNTAYTKNYDVTINDLIWSVPGNQNFSGYVRIGGKSLSNTARSITAKNAMASAISKITVSHNGKSNASLTVNKVTLTVASDADFSNVIETITLTPTIAATTAGSFDFTPASGSWATNSYYQITFTLTNSKTSNYGVDLTKMEFYSAGSTPTTVYLGLFLAAFVAVRACVRRVECRYATFHHIIMSKIDFGVFTSQKSALFVFFLGFVLFLSIKCRFLSFFLGEHVQICITSMVCIETAYDILSHCRNALPEPLSPCLGGGVSG